MKVISNFNLETLYKEFLKKKELGEVEDLGKEGKMF